jgi:predicted alpha/beta-fold hydrolase
VNTIKSKYPNRKICAIGFSLGAGLLLKYLGEEGENCPRSSVVAISPSFDFHVRGSQFFDILFGQMPAR